MGKRASGRVRIGLIGAGNMGKLHARVIAENPNTDLGVVIDRDPERAGALARTYRVPAALDLDGLDVDAAVIAVSTDAHLDVALDLLDEGIPLLVEKPLTPDRATFEVLVDAASRRGVALMCGFVERFSPVVQAAQSLLDGPVVHFSSVRHSPPPTRSTGDITTDLLIHDIDLAARFIDPLGRSQPSEICSPRSSTTAGGPDVRDCTIAYPGGARAVLSASRSAQRKIRTLRVVTGSSELDIDLLRQDLTVYRHVDHEAIQSGHGYRSSTTVDIPFVRVVQEPLAAQLDHFCSLVEGRADASIELERMRRPHEIVFALNELDGVRVPELDVSAVG